MLNRIIETSDDRIPMLARLALGIVVFPHGAQKLFGWFGGPGRSEALGYYASLGFPAWLGAIAMLVEFIGGALLLAGFLSRIWAAFAAALLAIAALRVHWPFGFFMNWSGRQQGEGFEFHILAITLAVIVMIRGSGALSMDRTLMRRQIETRAA